MNVPFHEKRRQLFISEKFYESVISHQNSTTAELLEELKNPENDSDDYRGLSYFLADDAYQLLSLHYTAGEPLDNLRNELEGVVAAYERYRKYLGIHEDAPQMAPLGFGMIDEYERCLQLIGLCYLLRRQDLLPRIAQLQDPGYYGHDVLYEELLDYGLEGRYDTDKLFHKKPYEHLVHAMYRDTDEESLADIKEYCRTWYPAMKTCPWHDGHLQMTDTDGHYFGYWAFEAGAIAFLLDIDDSSIDHMVYPKDLVAYARKLRDEGVTSPESTTGRLRGEPNAPVLKTGWWHSPAKPNGQALHWFEAGQHFPDIQSTDYGSVIWGFDPNEQKEPPKK